MRGVGDLKVEALVGGEEVGTGAGEGRHDSDDLEQGGSVLPGDLHVGVHVLEKLQENAGDEARHLLQYAYGEWEIREGRRTGRPRRG